MLFYISKVLAWFLVPINFIFALTLLLGLVTFFNIKWAGKIRIFLILIWFLVGYVPISEYLLRNLENKVIHSELELSELTGVIVLGGATGSGTVAEYRGQYTLNAAAERLTKAVEFSIVNPKGKIIFSGFSGSMIPSGLPDYKIAEKFFADLNVDAKKIFYDVKSRNTYENAIQVVKLLNDKNNETWGLITSASHMDRALKTFKKVAPELRLVPLVTDFRTGNEIKLLSFNLSKGNEFLLIWLHETIGSIYYKIFNFI